MLEANDRAIRTAVLLYASFDEHVRIDRGAGPAEPSTRFDHPTQTGAFVFDQGFDRDVFRIDPDAGIHGGALRVTAPLPRRGRIFFPAKGNLAYRPGGWGGSFSLWINTDPNTLIKSPFCDPIQITQRGANDGGLWIDFPDSKPRDMRLGAFSAALPGREPMKESDPQAPLVHVRKVPFQAGQWHHLAVTWRNFDTGRPDAEAVLYVDGRRHGALENREIAMRWDLAQTGIYVAVNYVGLLDELAVFDRPLAPAEIARLHAEPGLLGDLPSNR